MNTINKSIFLIILILTLPLMAYADKLKFTFNNTTNDTLNVWIEQHNFCFRMSHTETFKPKTSKQFYTAEGSLCDPSGHWDLHAYNNNFSIDSHVKVTKPNGECQITTDVNHRKLILLSGDCKKA